MGLLLLTLALYPAAALAKHGGPPPHGGKDGLEGDLDVNFCLILGTSCASSTPEMHFHVTVTQADPVKGAEVVLVVTKDGNIVSEHREKTGSDGVSHFEVKNPHRPEPGTYVRSISATKDKASGTACRVISLAEDGTFSDLGSCL